MSVHTEIIDGLTELADGLDRGEVVGRVTRVMTTSEMYEEVVLCPENARFFLTFLRETEGDL